jgi:cellulose synthase/poly-beta-1,6-N-acetylglucosamine synthase-like glycosyltransferase
MSEKQERTVSDPVLPESKEKVTGATEDGKPGLWKRLVNEYQKNYCPKESPPLVLPSAPNDKEKYSYVKMNRIPLLTVGLFSLLALVAGSWLFIKASPWYCWYALYAVISQFYLFTSYFITMLGKAFDLDAHKKLLEEQPLNEDTAPTVDIYLPVCKEAHEVLDNTWHHIAAIQYPAGKERVLVLDDGAQESVQTLAGRFGFEYICRDNRPELKKAGNLRYAFARTSGDFFTVFDADFCPRPDFLQELIPYHLNDTKIAIVQTPQFFRSTGNQTWTEQGAGSVQEYFYRIVQTCRNTWGGAICVGSNAIYRREALAAVGGTAPADCSEDVHTGFYAVTRGWTVKYLPLVLACGVCPDVPRAFFSQQMRWCTGSMSLLTHRDFWKSNLTKKQKFCYLTGFFYYSTTAIAAFLNPIPAPLLLWSHPNFFKYYNLFFAFPSVFLGLIALRLWARSRYTFSVQYTQVIMGYAYLHAVWDRFFGAKMVWLPSGDGKAHKNNRYRNMRILCWAWTITHNTVLITGCVWQISRGVMAWYHVIPALWLDIFNLFCVHRFLFYNHPKC